MVTRENVNFDVQQTLGVGGALSYGSPTDTNQ